jgi:predicted ABC-type sugar transport system permease subunit
MQAQQLIALLAGFLVMLVNGSLYVYGTMTPYIYTFLHFKGTLPPTQGPPWP